MKRAILEASKPLSRPQSETPGSRRSQVLWLWRLRWAAIVGQTITILVAQFAAGVDLPLHWLFAIVGAEAVFNGTVWLALRRGSDFGERVVITHLVLDLVALTALLHFAGGPSNPFNFLYLVQNVLAAVLLGTRVALVLVAVAATLFASLFVPGFIAGAHHHHHHHHHEMMAYHLEGMWIAFVIAAILIVYFVGRILAQLDANRIELAAERERAARTEQLSSLATLSAGAAHELATPLSTIAVVSKELARRIEKLEDSEEAMREDAILLRDEVERCQTILRRMSVSFGQSPGEFVEESQVKELVDAVVTEMEDPSRISCHFDPGVEGLVLALPRGSFRHALGALLDNALEASGEFLNVTLFVRSAGTNGMATHVELTVSDQGPGVPPEIRDRVVEPFFTTKPPGRGMGLGLFLADNVMRQLGGGLSIQSGEGGLGTSAMLRFPVSSSAERGG